MDSNPRFPHTLQVLRARMDENGDPMCDAKGDPIFDVLPLDIALMDSEDDCGLPLRNDSGQVLTIASNTLRWGYRTSTGGFRDSGDVAEADFKIATEMFLTPLDTGDVVIMTDYDRTWRMEVLKKTTYNWGSNIWVKDVKN